MNKNGLDLLVEGGIDRILKICNSILSSSRSQV